MVNIVANAVEYKNITTFI